MSTISKEHSDRLYWLGRYTERFFTTLKALDRMFDKMLGKTHAYSEYLEHFGIYDTYTDNKDFIHSFLYDINNPNPAAYSPERAYDNGIVLREEISTSSLSFLQMAKDTLNDSQSSRKTRLSLVTGTHGDEPEGQYLAYIVGEYIDKNIEKPDGILDIYPALNPMGIDSITRGIPMFDLDMNRVFPGSSAGTMVEAVCAAIVDDISGSDVCVDVHSSNIFLKEIPQIRISVSTADILVPYAKMMNVDFVWIHESATVLESTLAHTLNSRDTKTLVVEMGVGMRITKEYCVQLFDGIFNLMKELGMWKGDTSPVREPIVSQGRDQADTLRPCRNILQPDRDRKAYRSRRCSGKNNRPV